MSQFNRGTWVIHQGRAAVVVGQRGLYRTVRFTGTTQTSETLVDNLAPCFKLTDCEEVTRGQLTGVQVKLLDAYLVDADLPKSSPYTNPERVAKVCLNCGSVAVAADTETRDFTVDNFDMRCCGLTVIFHSKHRTLINPSSLTIRRADS